MIATGSDTVTGSNRVTMPSLIASISTTAALASGVVQAIKSLDYCRRCTKRTVGRVGELCGVCRGKGRR